MKQPPWDTFKKPTCKGCYALGSACGHCEKCEWERNQRYESDNVTLEQRISSKIKSLWDLHSTEPATGFTPDEFAKEIMILINDSKGQS